MVVDKTADETADEPVVDDKDPKESSRLGELPKVDFSTFVLSLGTTALYQLGVMSDPVSGEGADPDPLIAQQTIDTLEMLREKTLGNLDDEERRLIDSLLFELRMRFVELGR
jgi:hypothetical protein